MGKHFGVLVGLVRLGVDRVARAAKGCYSSLEGGALRSYLTAAVVSNAIATAVLFGAGFEWAETLTVTGTTLGFTLVFCAFIELFFVPHD